MLPGHGGPRTKGKSKVHPVKLAFATATVATYRSIHEHSARIDGYHAKVVVGARVKDLYDKAAKERQKKHASTAPGKAKNTCDHVTTSVSGKSRDAAGQAVGVSGSLAQGE